MIGQRTRGGTFVHRGPLWLGQTAWLSWCIQHRRRKRPMVSHRPHVAMPFVSAGRVAPGPDQAKLTFFSTSTSRSWCKQARHILGERGRKVGKVSHGKHAKNSCSQSSALIAKKYGSGARNLRRFIVFFCSASIVYRGAPVINLRRDRGGWSVVVSCRLGADQDHYSRKAQAAASLPPTTSQDNSCSSQEAETCQTKKGGRGGVGCRFFVCMRERARETERARKKG